ncbi:hypothetical protein [Allostreptomyces psammosilenae]|uniref:Uncharacterized protein n=1 Tax=Allostreptomyces psammosilenae TaxID=1892865 RepID=A0A852ZNM0_9ACTN|nr:hypothetical protein [Allostreptomyces psammosilenae]NYI04046.1 hypothetical protein [Allostreptomyces psammosilenae]
MSTPGNTTGNTGSRAAGGRRGALLLAAAIVLALVGGAALGNRLQAWNHAERVERVERLRPSADTPIPDPFVAPGRP